MSYQCADYTIVRGTGILIKGYMQLFETTSETVQQKSTNNICVIKIQTLKYLITVGYINSTVAA